MMKHPLHFPYKLQLCFEVAMNELPINKTILTFSILNNVTSKALISSGINELNCNNQLILKILKPFYQVIIIQ